MKRGGNNLDRICVALLIFFMMGTVFVGGYAFKRIFHVFEVIAR